MELAILFLNFPRFPEKKRSIRRRIGFRSGPQGYAALLFICSYPA
jgi:hypothetical protein